MPFLSFSEHNSKSIQDIQNNFATHIKQEALMFHLRFSVENTISVVKEKVRIYGDEDI